MILPSWCWFSGCFSTSAAKKSTKQSEVRKNWRVDGFPNSGLPWARVGHVSGTSRDVSGRLGGVGGVGGKRVGHVSGTCRARVGLRLPSHFCSVAELERDLVVVHRIEGWSGSLQLPFAYVGPKERCFALIFLYCFEFRVVFGPELIFFCVGQDGLLLKALFLVCIAVHWYFEPSLLSRRDQCCLVTSKLCFLPFFAVFGNSFVQGVLERPGYEV